MDFNKIEYKRIDFESYKKEFNALLSRLDSVGSFEKFVAYLDDINALRKQVDTMKTLAEIKFSINTTDDFFVGENQYWDEFGPMFSELDLDLYERILSSDYKENIIKRFGRQYYDLINCSVKSFSSDIIDLVQKENRLMSEYTQLLASASIDFDGKK